MLKDTDGNACHWPIMLAKAHYRLNLSAGRCGL